MKLLQEKTEICRICFKEYQRHSYRTLTTRESFLCDKCYSLLAPRFIQFEISNTKGISIYEYDDFVKEKLYTFKGCYDYELAPIFIFDFAKMLKIKYGDYSIVPVPSYVLDDEKRGFNHVEEIFKCLSLPFIKVLEKTNPLKQSDQSAEERKDVIKRLKIVSGGLVKNKKILLVDDVLTTGSTLEACLELLSTFKPKRIEILVMSKVEFRKKKSSILEDVEQV